MAPITAPICEDVDGQIFETGVQEKTVRFDWVVNNFGMVREHDFLISEQQMEFEVVDANGVKTKWRLALTKSNDNDWIGLRRSLVSTTDPSSRSTRTKVTVKINGVVAITHNVIMEIQPGGCLFSGRFISKDWKTPADDKVTITFILTIYSVMAPKARVPDPVETHIKAFQEICHERVWKLLSSLVGDTTTSDATVISKDNKEFPVHRMILAKASPVFERMFLTDMLEKESGVIRCPDISGACIQVLMSFIYTGRFSENKEEWTQPDVLWELTYAAGKYQLDLLLDFFDNILGVLVKPEDAPKFLSLANKLELKKAQKELHDVVIQLSSSSPEMFFEVVNAMQ